MRHLALPAALAGAVLVSAPLAAQQDARGPAATSAVAASKAPTTVPPEDFGKWESLFGASLSPDGRWLAAPIRRVNEENELRVHRVSNPDSVIVVPYGGSPSFSRDGRWLAYSIGMGEDEREKLQERKQPIRDDLGLVDLRTGVRTIVEDVSSFGFSRNGRFLAMRRYPPAGEREAEGVDLVVRDLETGVDVNFGNVSEFAWQDEGDLLAMVVDAEGMAGNGVRLWEPATGRLRPLESRAARYSGLTWRDESADLAVFRTADREADGEEAWSDTAHVVVAFRGVDDGARGGATALTLDPAAHAAIPADHRIVPWQELRWSEDGRTLFFGIKEREPADRCETPGNGEGSGGGPTEPGEGDEAPADTADAAPPCEAGEDDEDPTVEIWHAGDVDIVPTQKVRAGRDRRENDLAAWHLSGAVVRLEDDLTEDVRIVDGASYVVGTDGSPYDAERMFGPEYRDAYVVDLATGEKTKALEKVQYFFGPSAEGRYLLFLEDDHYRTYDVRSGAVTCITCGLPEATFVDLEDDHTVEQKPPFRHAGWLEDDEAVLIYDEHDVWRVAPDGSGGERLTRGAEQNVAHRRVRVDREEEAIDPDAPQYYALYDDWAETWGYGRSDRLGDDVDVLTMREARVYGLQKAEETDVFAWAVEDFEDSPDVFVGTGALEGEQVTRTNPFQSDYLWGTSELIEYVNVHGDTLQGSLYYPAGYEPGKRYPMITYIYEIRSNAVRSYEAPSQRDYYNFQTWVQDGYFVFQPDIVYRDRNPGLSAVENIEPAVDAVVATGMVDPDRIGLIGHSWGGYQTTFFVTQSDMFAAAVAGAPLTNLFSMYLSVYWNSGGTDARIFEISQGRMEVPFWEDEESYRANSPVFHIENMRTPLLMAQGTEDGAVDFNQGVEFYNAARRAGKDFVFLVYNDENHGFRKEPNQLDYHRRINEWFGHYLKGEPAPAWMTEGVPYLEQPGGKQRAGGG